MTKTELVEAVARDLNMTRVDAQRAVESVFGQIAEGLARDKKVQIQGFGTFQSKMRKAREGINPQTKQRMQIPASKTVGFKPGQELEQDLTAPRRPRPPLRRRRLPGRGKRATRAPGSARAPRCRPSPRRCRARVSRGSAGTRPPRGAPPGARPRTRRRHGPTPRGRRARRAARRRLGGHRARGERRRAAPWPRSRAPCAGRP